MRHAVYVNGVTRIALTKLDVLSGIPELKICTGYAGLSGVPADATRLEAVEPVYETLPGWEEASSHPGSVS